MREARISRDPDGGFAVEVPDLGGTFTLVGTWPTFDAACDWAARNPGFLITTMVEHDGNVDIFSHPPRGVKWPT
jgi:predicted RNase H-like HicB family nuclease